MFSALAPKADLAKSQPREFIMKNVDGIAGVVTKVIKAPRAGPESRNEISSDGSPHPCSPLRNGVGGRDLARVCELAPLELRVNCRAQRMAGFKFPVPGLGALTLGDALRQ